MFSVIRLSIDYDEIQECKVFCVEIQQRVFQDAKRLILIAKELYHNY